MYQITVRNYCVSDEGTLWISGIVFNAGFDDIPPNRHKPPVWWCRRGHCGCGDTEPTLTSGWRWRVPVTSLRRPSSSPWRRATSPPSCRGDSSPWRPPDNVAHKEDVSVRDTAARNRKCTTIVTLTVWPNRSHHLNHSMTLIKVKMTCGANYLLFEI